MKTPKVFVVSPSLPRVVFTKFQATHKIVHAPLITLSPLVTPPSTISIIKKRSYQGLILTSKHAARHTQLLYHKIKKQLLPPFIFCVGKATEIQAKKELNYFIVRAKTSPQFICAQEETQEGVFDLICRILHPHEKNRLLWPSSSGARPTLKTLLHTGYLLDHIPLYRPLPVFRHLTWESQDIVFFGCSSSVHAFFTFFPQALSHPPLFHTIGKITEKTLETYLS